MITGVHHINLLVRDLDAAMVRYRRQLGVTKFEEAELAGRGVRTARFKAGSTWIVLVQPIAPGEPQRVLDTQGEGLFLLSFEVEDLSEAMDRVSDNGGALTSASPRTGLDSWQVIDLDPKCLANARVQLTASAGAGQPKSIDT